MRFVRYQIGEKPRLGVEVQDKIIDALWIFPELQGQIAPDDMTALITFCQDKLDLVANKIKDIGNFGVHDKNKVKILSPTINPPKFICAWVNYPNPAMAKMPDVPIFFSKVNSAIIGPDDAIQLPKIGDQIVVEPEMAAIIGKGGRHIKEEDALSHVFGYTILNDVTAFSHRLQILLGAQGPYGMAKSFDTFAPCGPAIVTSDEIGDPLNLNVKQTLNGEVKTTANTSQMVYQLPYMISYLSDFFTLQPGDMIVSGSPAPTSGKPEFLSDGDIVEITYDKIGILRNSVIKEPN